MQSINLTAVTPTFMLALFGTALRCAVLVLRALTSWGDRQAALLLFGAAGFIVGAVVLTAVDNVPLNNTLAGMSPDSAGAAAFWHSYARNWTIANHVRTASCVVAMVLLMLSLHIHPSGAAAARSDRTQRTDVRIGSAASSPADSFITR